MLAAPVRSSPVVWSELFKVLFDCQPDASSLGLQAALERCEVIFSSALPNNKQSTVIYGRLLLDLSAMTRDWPRSVWNRFFPPWLYCGKQIVVDSLKSEACLVLYAASMQHVQCALSDLGLITVDHSLKKGSSAIPSVHAKSAYLKASIALELLGACIKIAEGAAPVPGLSVDLVAVASAIELIAATSKYFYSLLSESFMGRHGTLAKVAAAAASKSCPQGSDEGMLRLPVVLFAAAHKHLAEAAYAAETVPDMSAALGHITVADDTLKALNPISDEEKVKIQHVFPTFVSMSKEITVLRAKYEYENNHVYFVPPAPPSCLPDMAAIVLTTGLPTISSGFLLLESVNPSSLEGFTFPSWDSIQRASEVGRNAAMQKAQRDELTLRIRKRIESAKCFTTHDAAFMTTLSSLCRLAAGQTIKSAVDSAATIVSAKLHDLQQNVEKLRQGQKKALGRVLPHADDISVEWQTKGEELLKQVSKWLEHADSFPELCDAPLHGCDEIANIFSPSVPVLSQTLVEAERALAHLPNYDADAIKMLDKLVREIDQQVLNQNQDLHKESMMNKQTLTTAAQLLSLSKKLISGVELSILETEGMCSKLASQTAALDETPLFADPVPRARSKQRKGKQSQQNETEQFPEALVVGEGLRKRLRDSSPLGNEHQ